MVPERLHPVLNEANELARLFADAGFRLYLVGGVVRDALLDRLEGSDHDLDFTTDALPEQTEAVLAPWADAIWAQGKRFGTIGAAKRDRRFEITTHRAEEYDSSSRKPDVVFSTALEADLARRDFTVNAMALSLPDLVLVDPFDGVADLAAKKLRTPLSQRSPLQTTPSG